MVRAAGTIGGTDGGYIGFPSSPASVDDLTIEANVDSNWVTQHVDEFTVDANGYAADKPTHDAAGNLTYDGRYACTFDAWNRLATVARAYPTSTGHATGSAVSTIQYDGLHRRIVKQVAHTGLDTDATFHYYYDTSWRLLETRCEYNGPTQKLAKHHVWGARYIDELIQIGVNKDANDDCDAFYYAATNANFNVIGLIDDANGSLVERYEYTPYGRRTVYAKSGLDDWLTSAPMWHSQLVDGKPYTLCDIGHQGLRHEDESGLIYNRHRYLHVRFGRYMSADKAGYVDGMNAHEYLRTSPITLQDPTGNAARGNPKENPTGHGCDVGSATIYFGHGRHASGHITGGKTYHTTFPEFAKAGVLSCFADRYNRPRTLIEIPNPEYEKGLRRHIAAQARERNKAVADLTAEEILKFTKQWDTHNSKTKAVRRQVDAPWLISGFPKIRDFIGVLTAKQMLNRYKYLKQEDLTTVNGGKGPGPDKFRALISDAWGAAKAQAQGMSRERKYDYMAVAQFCCDLRGVETGRNTMHKMDDWLNGESLKIVTPYCDKKICYLKGKRVSCEKIYPNGPVPDCPGKKSGR